jgi:glycosyltransferase involved in cell wall biosynthesis
MTPFFSVVIPIYNRAHELETALRSVLSQTESSLEAIVVDDGSTDSPESVIDAIGDPRVIYVRQANRGGGAARNAGIDCARGRYIAFLDSDDRFLRHHLATMRQLLESENGAAGYAPVIVDRGAGCSFVKPPRALGPREHMADYLLCDRGFIPTITLVVPRPWAKRVRYAENLPFAQDTDFAIRLFLAGCRFVMAPEPAAVWNDIRDPGRISAGRKNARLAPWLEHMRRRIPARSYHGARGWIIAKGVAQTRPFAAFGYYINAVLRGCYRPRLAAVIFLQIFASDRFYRNMADWLIGLRRGRIWSHGACAPQSALR